MAIKRIKEEWKENATQDFFGVFLICLGISALIAFIITY